MENSKSKSNGVFIFIVGVVGVIILMGYIVSSKDFPSIGSMIASSTSEGSKIFSNYFATTTPVADSRKDFDDQNNFSYSTSTLRLPKGNIVVEISNTPEKRTLGLSNRTYLKSDTGMLFIFPTAGSYNFWMKDMHFPLDIVWIKSDREVAGISRNIRPDSFPAPVIPPDEIQFVLELNAGDADRLGITTGTSLNF